MKIAFCGRNSCGKSYLALTLTPYIEPEKRVFTLDSVLAMLKAEDKKYELLTLFTKKTFIDTSVEILLPRVLEFSFYVKVLATLLTGLSFNYFDGSQRQLRETYNPLFEKSPRNILEEIGTWGRNINKDFWISAALENFKKYHIADLRYRNEAIAAKKENYLVICLYNQQCKAKKIKSDVNYHDSLWSFTQFPDLYDGMMRNDSETYAFNFKILNRLINPILDYNYFSPYAWANKKRINLNLPCNYLGKQLITIKPRVFIDEVETVFDEIPEKTRIKILKRVEKMKIFRNLFLILDEKKYALAELCFVLAASFSNFTTKLTDILNFER